MPRRETEPSSQSTAIERVEQRAPTASQERPSLNDALRYHQDFQNVSAQDASSSAGPQTALLEERRGTKRSAQEVGLTASSTVPGSISMQSLRMQAHYLMETGIYSSEAREKRKAAVKAAMNRPEVKEKHQAAMNRPEVKEKRQAAIKVAMNRPEVKAAHRENMKKRWQEGTGQASEQAKEKRKATLNRPEVKEKLMEAHLERQAKERKEVFKPTDLATANSTASAVLGGKSYAWMKPGGSSQQG